MSSHQLARSDSESSVGSNKSSRKSVRTTPKTPSKSTQPRISDSPDRPSTSSGSNVFVSPAVPLPPTGQLPAAAHPVPVPLPSVPVLGLPPTNPAPNPQRVRPAAAPVNRRAMGYAETVQHYGLYAHKFVSLRDLLSVLTKRSTASHSVHEERSNTIREINDLRSAYTYSATTRFPEGVLLVDLTDSNVGTLIRRYVSSLDYGERMLDREADSSRSARFSAVDDKTLAANKTLDKLLSILSRQPRAIDGVYDRSEFERIFELVWS